MNKEEIKFGGVIVPMVTPFKADLSIDEQSVARIMKTFTESDISTFILGTTGEAVSVSENQKTVFVESAIRSSAGQVKIYAGISGNCLSESIDTGNRYADLGVDAAVIHLPFFYPISESSMLNYFESVANAVKCPVLLYNNPLTVRWSTPLEVIDKLSSHPNVVGFKDSENGLERVDKAVELWSERTDFTYLMGCAANSAYAVLKGCHGIVPSVGNLIPELYKQLFDAALAGNSKEAHKFQKMTDEINNIPQRNRDISHSIPALKGIMSEFGLCEPYAMLPMKSISAQEQKELGKEVHKKLDSFKNLVS